MPMQIDQIEEDGVTVLVVRLSNPWTFDMFDAIQMEAVARLDAMGTRAFLIIDCTQANAVPPDNFRNLRTFGPLMRHKNLVSAIVFGLTTHNGHIIATMVSNLYSDVVVVDTWEDALHEARNRLYS